MRGVDIDDALVAGGFDPAEVEARRIREYEGMFGPDDSDGEEGEPPPSILRVCDRSVMPRAAETDSAVRDDDEDDETTTAKTTTRAMTKTMSKRRSRRRSRSRRSRRKRRRTTMIMPTLR